MIDQSRVTEKEKTPRIHWSAKSVAL